MRSLEETLKLIRSSASFEYNSHSGLSFVLEAQLAFATNRDLCLGFLQCCFNYGNFATRLYSETWPTSSGVGASHDLRECSMIPPFETTSAAAEDAANVKGSRKFKAAYKQALSLEHKTILELNTLLGNLSTLGVVPDGLPDDLLPGVVTRQQLDELSYAWAKARDSVRAAMASLTSEPARRLYYRSASLALPPPRSRMRLWMRNLVVWLS